MAITTEYVDRVPGDPGRVKITTDGQSYYATIERADNPVVVGTKINAEIMSELKDNINALDKLCDELSNRVTALEKKVNTLETKVTALEKRQNIAISISGNTLNINEV